MLDERSDRVGSKSARLLPSQLAALMRLTPSGTLFESWPLSILLKVAGQLKKLPHTIEIEGHTDNVPITGPLAKRYPSNWELAGARAASVVRLFERAGIEKSRLAAVSYSSSRPIASNETEEDRSRNRRIEIRLQPDSDGDAASQRAEGGTAASGS